MATGLRRKSLVCPVAAAPGARQVGASALELALVLPLFILLLLGAIHYGVLFTLQQSLTLAAEEGARASVAVSPATPNYQAAVCARANQAVQRFLQWLPTDWAGRITTNCTLNMADDPVTVRVQVRYPNYSGMPPVPALQGIHLPMLPAMETLPPLPQMIGAEALVQL